MKNVSALTENAVRVISIHDTNVLALLKSLQYNCNQNLFLISVPACQCDLRGA